MNKAPNGVLLVCATVFLSVLVGCFTLLALKGADATELRSLIQTLLSAAGVVLGGGSFLYAGIAARRSDEAAENTNGKLTERVETAVHNAVSNALNGKGGTTDGRPDV